MLKPHGGKLIQQIVSEDAELKYWDQKSKELISITLESEQIKEIKNIARGLYSPVNGYMSKQDFLSVCTNTSLSDGTVWPIPLALDVTKSQAKDIHIGRRIALRDIDKNLIAILIVKDKYTVNKEKAAKDIFTTSDVKHPGVSELLNTKEVFLGGDILLVENDKKTYNKYNLDPVETRILFKEKGWNTIVGFQTRNAPHRAHEYLQKCALETCEGLFINPVIGRKKKGDFTDEAIIASYQTLIRKYYPKNRVVFSILPLKMRYAGPKEAIFHAIIRKNFGCTHFVVGRDHAGVSDFYGSYDAHDIFSQIDDIGIEILKFDHAFYCEICNNMGTRKTCSHENKFRVLPSGTLIRQKIREKQELPEEMIRSEILSTLQNLDNVFVK